MKKLRVSQFLLVLLVAFLPIIFYGCPTPLVTDTDSKWLVLVYLDGDNNLEGAAIDDFNEIENALYNLGDADINILALFDRTSIYDTSNDNWAETRLYQVMPDNDSDTINSILLKNYGELNMGNPVTLSNFISYAKNNYTYENLMLIFWNHGGGARSKDITLSTSSPLTKAVCWDYTDDEDCLYLDEVQQALSSKFDSSNKLDILGFDACLMGTVEVAYEFVDIASYMVASMHTEQGDGWDYEKIFYGGSTNCPVLTSTDYETLTPSELAIRIVKSYRDFIEETYSDTAETMSAIDLTKIGAIKLSLDTLAAQLKDYKALFESFRDDAIHFWENDDDSISYPYFDFYDLMLKIETSIPALTIYCDAVIANLKEAVLYAYGNNGYTGDVVQGYYFGSGTDIGHGLSIFVSRGDILYSSYSHYAYQWWYTDVDTDYWQPDGYYYGLIDFAQSDDDGDVEYWRELFEYWYDPLNEATPGTW